MTTDKLDKSLQTELAALAAEGRAKAPERIITEFIPQETIQAQDTGLKAPAKNISGSIQTPICLYPFIRRLFRRQTRQPGNLVWALVRLGL